MNDLSAHERDPKDGVSREVFERLLRVAREMASSEDLQEILRQIVDALRDLLDAERASVFQYDEQTDELFATSAHGLPTSMRLPADQGLIGEAARTREIVVVNDAYSDERFNPKVDQETGFRTRNILTVPMVDFEGGLVGVAQVLNKHGCEFGAQDETIAQYLADQAGVALKRASLIQSRFIKRQLEADIAIARRIQQAALPSSLPKIPGYDLACSFEPADDAGGDAYDVVALDPEARRTLIYLGDATGHGVGPALSAAQAVSMLRMGRRLGAGIEDIAQHMNEQLLEDLPGGRFVTAFIGALDADRHELVYVSAGQAPLVVVRRGGDVESMGSSCMPLGIEGPLAIEHSEPIVFGAGDVFLLLSDGFYEAQNSGGKEFGVEGVTQAVLAALDASAGDILQRIAQCFDQHTGGARRADDLTAIVLKRLR